MRKPYRRHKSFVRKTTPRSIGTKRTVFYSVFKCNLIIAYIFSDCNIFLQSKKEKIAPPKIRGRGIKLSRRLIVFNSYLKVNIITLCEVDISRRLVIRRDHEIDISITVSVVRYVNFSSVTILDKIKVLII